MCIAGRKCWRFVLDRKGDGLIPPKAKHMHLMYIFSHGLGRIFIYVFLGYLINYMSSSSLYIKSDVAFVRSSR